MPESIAFETDFERQAKRIFCAGRRKGTSEGEKTFQVEKSDTGGCNRRRKS